MTEQPTNGAEPQPGDKDCAQSKDRSHRWNWKWDIGGKWTDIAYCVHCGTEKVMKRPSDERGVAP